MTLSAKNSSNPAIRDPKLIVALDYDNQQRCLDLAAQLDPSYCRLKVGKEMFTHFGPVIVESLQSLGFEVFLDLKFHDIPNTVAKAVSAAAGLGVWMTNVHASGGLAMMEAAKNTLAHLQSPPLLIAVTVLTSLSDEDIAAVGLQGSAADCVARLACLSARAELDGVVCSAREAGMIKTACGKDFLTVTPGIRPSGADVGDQHRVLSPSAAIKGGSDYLVVGRPITQAKDPLLALKNITKEMILEKQV